jgi:hypothetical protein
MGWVGMGLWAGILCTHPFRLQAQEVPEDLAAIVANARSGWLTHDVQAVVQSADTLRLGFPGVANSAAMRPGHAARVLWEYLKPAKEIRLELRSIGAVTDDHRYAQMVRHYVVQGTSDERVETVYLGFHRIDGVWRLREIRVTP